jgi:membrane protease YdiL (CAAX protease family)
MKDEHLGHLLRAFREQFAAHRHSALLAVIIAALAVRSLVGGGGAGYIVFSAVLLVLLLVALYNINVDELTGERKDLLAQSRRRRQIGWALVAAAFVERLAVVYTHSRSLN